MTTEVSHYERNAVLDTLETYRAAWSATDFQAIADLWATGPHELTYIAEELGEVLYDRERIVEHLLRTKQRVPRCEMKLKAVHIARLTPDLVLTSFICRWEIDWVSYSRVGAVLRRENAGWRFVHYMESPFHLEDWDTEIDVTL